MKTEIFEMRFSDRFNFQGRRTVFVGKVFGHPMPIRSLLCDLKIGKTILGRILLKGEMLREERGGSSGLRSVTTLDIIPELPEGEIIIVEAAP